LHSHSVSSDDSRATVEQYLNWIQVLRRREYRVDAIVLTEHRKFDRDADYSSLVREHDVLVLKGSELDTRYGHFLVYGVSDALLRAIDFSDVAMDPFQLMREAREHGAIAIPAHPGRPGIGLCEFIDGGVEFPGVGIVETLNGGSRKGENEKALALARQRAYRGIGGSDAHLVSGVATCITAFQGKIAREEELVEALLWGEFLPLRLEETRSLLPA
jgi:predicted metal-dependent phosphoesterase TrpH